MVRVLHSAYFDIIQYSINYESLEALCYEKKQKHKEFVSYL